jgi:uncharacterized protein (DUF302 family)
MPHRLHLDPPRWSRAAAPWLALGALLVPLPARPSAAGPPAEGPAYGVYVRLAEGIRDRGFDDVVAALRGAVTASDWTLLADYAAAVPRSGCAFRAHVFAVLHAEYAAAVLAHGVTAAFALPLRLAVYEDEAGIHISATNPRSLNRTIVTEAGLDERSAGAVAALKRLVATAFPGHVVERQHGQLRDRGEIGKTMGIMAGGPFPSKVEEIATVRAVGPAALDDVATRLQQGLERVAGRRRWETRPVYQVRFPEQGIAIIGVTGAAMESKAFEIVQHGGDEARQGFACAGIDHAAAFPIELVLARDGDAVRVLIVDEMFRMKLYFEDAGKMKFAMNMQMPGSIENEIRDKVADILP